MDSEELLTRTSDAIVVLVATLMLIADVAIGIAEASLPTPTSALELWAGVPCGLAKVSWA